MQDNLRLTHATILILCYVAMLGSYELGKFITPGRAYVVSSSWADSIYKLCSSYNYSKDPNIIFKAGLIKIKDLILFHLILKGYIEFRSLFPQILCEFPKLYALSCSLNKILS